MLEEGNVFLLCVCGSSKRMNGREAQLQRNHGNINPLLHSAIRARLAP